MTPVLLLDILKLFHGTFNTLLAFAFLYQALLGYAIREGRTKGEPRFDAVRTHRRIGPLLIVLGVVGFCFGLLLVSVDTGNLLEHPLHLAIGAVIVAILLAQYGISKKIRAQDPSWRAAHSVLGVAILCLYLAQLVIGIGIML